MLLRKYLMVAKTNSKLYQTSEMEIFRKSLLASKANSESCQTYKIEPITKIVKN